ncbi:TetR/AcrR family transcriptional regulator [Paenibacillus arenilitoris]|uniref:TetR/AcrR family transcriptional regulator n=1 Tax=Paenibacillus arenilitoris TaxID=2772299 RepID=A0A927H8B6_9BACL|nr:TetR/AcrR family transcriptional regulator [Paenibacillus arenilitoris]MBD2871397.1 TetR/AcrR family transcriptional regulator [Paenibacillus arenilitoris]
MDLKTRIAEAAEQVIRANGLAKTTTKEIARIAGCSEGSLYNHFKSKEDLFLYVLRGQLTNLMGALTALRELAGQGTVRGNLEKVALAAVADYYQSMSFICSVISERDLLNRHREGFAARNEGPHRANETLEAYLSEEKLLGRVHESISPRAAADLLLGSCFQHAFQLRFLGREESEEQRSRFVKHTLDALFEGLQAREA